MGNPIAKPAKGPRVPKSLKGGWSAFRASIVDESPAARIRAIRAGTEAGQLVHAADMLGVSRETIFGLVGLPPSTANRKIARGETLEPAVTERLARLAVVEQQAAEAFGDATLARDWLRSPNTALGGATPLSMLDTEFGSREVSRILAAIAYGGVV